MDDLIREIKKSKLGTKIGDTDTSVIMYADDLIISSSSIPNLNKLLKICEEYGKKWEIKYNPEKTQFIAFNSKETLTNENIPTFEKKKLEQVKTMKYLGVWLDNKLNSSLHLDKMRINMIKSMYNLNMIGLSSLKMNYETKSTLYKTFMRPILYYGIENLKISKTQTQKLQTAEGNLIKKIMNLPKQSHTTKLINTLYIEPTTEKIKTIKASFLLRLLDNKLTREIILHKMNETHNENCSFVSEIKNTINPNTKNTTEELLRNLCQRLMKNINTEKKNATKGGIQDTIRYCLDNPNKENHLFLLQLTAPNFKKTNHTTHTNTN